MFAYPAGLLALLGIPVVLGLHLYRRRFRRQVVSALFLWETQDHDPSAGRRREPLRRSASLLAELLGVLALALAFAGLRGCGAARVDHLVVVLDSSASMGATTASGSALERAKDLVAQRIAGLDSDGRVTLVRSGPRPEVLVGPAALRDEAGAALDAFQPGRIHHDLEPAVALAEQLGASAPVLVVTDRIDAQLPDGVELRAVGDAAANLAIVAATRRRLPGSSADAGDDEIRLSVACFGGLPRSVTLEATWTEYDGSPRRVERTLELAPGETRSFSAPVDRRAGTVHASLPADALELDNHAWLAPEPARKLLLASTLDPERLAALGFDESLERLLALVPESELAEAGEAHLVLGPAPDGPEHDGSANTWSLAFAGSEPQPADSPAGAPAGEAAGGLSLAGPFLVDRSTPLLRGVTLEGVVWTTALPAASGALLRGLPLVSAGNRPLLVELEQSTRFAIDLDPARSSLLRSPDWPILLVNLAEMRRKALPGPARRNLVLGESLVFVDDAPATYRLVGEGETLGAQAKGTLVLDSPLAGGAYTLERRTGQGEFRPVSDITWSFVDASESDLTNSSSGSREPILRASLDGEEEVVGGGGARAASTRVELALIALALLAGLANWFVLAPRKRD